MAEDASLQSELVTTFINKHLGERRTGKSGGVISGKGELKTHGTTIIGLLLSTDNTIVIAADGRKAYEYENKGLEVQNDETIKLCEFGKTFVIGLAGCSKVCKNLQFRLRMMKKIGGLEDTKNKVWGMLQNVTSMYEDSIEAILTGVQLVDGKRSVFVRDFIPSELAFLMNREPEIVKNFILKTLRSWEKKIDRFPREGVLPASFKVHHDSAKNKDTMEAEFCETVTGRVAPVDYGFWWIFFLRAYTRSTGDTMLAELPECQMAMQLILSLCLSEGFNTFPTLLCTDGCSIIERQMVSSCRTLSQFASYELLATVLIVL
ncbi:Probable alkaline/neutral invertase B [Linum perenne]